MSEEEAMFGSEPKPTPTGSVTINGTESKPKKKINLTKWFALGVGGLLGLSYIGMVGTVVNKSKDQLPDLDLPVGPYTSYVVSADKDGYKISYIANDPKTAYITKDIKTKGGFLGLATETTKVAEEYFMDGQTNQGGAVSNTRSWLDQKPGLTASQTAEIVAARKSEACIEAVGSAKGTGRLVGTSIGASAAPALSGIPFIGWVAAGWVAMFGGDQGANIGGNMAEDLNKNC